MKSQWRGWAIVLPLSFLLTFALADVAFAAPEADPQRALPTCSWVLETTGSGATNVAYPDTDATYWTMPFDTTKWKGLIIKGTFPESRFFSFATYVAQGSVVDSINDVAVDPKDEVVAAGECAHQVMRGYYPRAVFCDKQLLLDRGWQACFAAAGLPAS